MCQYKSCEEKFFQNFEAELATFSPKYCESFVLFKTFMFFWSQEIVFVGGSEVSTSILKR